MLDTVLDDISNLLEEWEYNPIFQQWSNGMFMAGLAPQQGHAVFTIQLGHACRSSIRVDEPITKDDINKMLTSIADKVNGDIATLLKGMR